jgi:hypothetical protein
MSAAFCRLRLEYSALQKSEKYRVVTAGGISSGRYPDLISAAKNSGRFDARLFAIMTPVDKK